MAEYVESKEKAEKSILEARKAKLQTLERQLGIQSSSSGAAGIGSSAGEPSDSTISPAPAASIPKAPATSAEVDVSKVAQKRHRFDDNQYFDTSREINESVRSAVTAGTFSLTIIGVAIFLTNPHRSTEEEEEGQA